MRMPFAAVIGAVLFTSVAFAQDAPPPRSDTGIRSPSRGDVATPAQNPGPGVSVTIVCDPICHVVESASAPRDEGVGTVRPGPDGGAEELSVPTPALALPQQGGPKAFPSAVGYGAMSRGGRGGKVFVVNTLADSGPGSLRECMQATGPRICTFSVSGTIELLEPIWVKSPNGFLTVAGQTSPGGIQLTQAATPVDGRTPIIVQDTTEIVLRHLRVRGRWERGDPAFKRQSLDSITFERTANVYVDHISAAWAADEGINFHQGAQNVTVANSILAENLAGHPYGGLSCSDAHQRGCGRVTWWANIFHGHQRRSPSDKTAGPRHGVVEVINNVVSNAGLVGIEVWDDHGGTYTNIVGNVGLPGPKNNMGTRCTTTLGLRHCTALINEGNHTADENYIYAVDNIAVPPLPLWDGNHCTLASKTAGHCAITPNPRAVPYAPLTLTPWPVSQTEDHVTARAGAWPRDSLDQRFVDEVLARDGAANSPQNGGPWPVMPDLAAPSDVDEDGMPDAWEQAQGVTDPSADNDGDGYTNIEEYLEERHVALVAQVTRERAE